MDRFKAKPTFYDIHFMCQRFEGLHPSKVYLVLIFFVEDAGAGPTTTAV